MKKIIFFLAVILFIHQSLLAQRNARLSPVKSKYLAKKEKGFDKRNLLIGGNLGIGGGFGTFGLNVEPTLLYKFTPSFHAGVITGVNFYRENVPFTDIFNQNKIYRYNATNYSLGFLARYCLGNFFCIQAQPELNNVKHLRDLNYNNTGTSLVEDSYRMTTPSFLVGLGYLQGDARGGAYYATSVMYDMVQNPNSPYYQQIVLKFGLYMPLFTK